MWIALAVDPAFVIALSLVFVLLLEVSAYKLCHVAAALAVSSLAVAGVRKALESFLGMIAVTGLHNWL